MLQSAFISSSYVQLARLVYSTDDISNSDQISSWLPKRKEKPHLPTERRAKYANKCDREMMPPAPQL